MATVQEDFGTRLRNLQQEMDRNIAKNQAFTALACRIQGHFLKLLPGTHLLLWTVIQRWVDNPKGMFPPLAANEGVGLEEDLRKERRYVVGPRRYLLESVSAIMPENMWFFAVKFLTYSITPEQWAWADSTPLKLLKCVTLETLPILLDALAEVGWEHVELLRHVPEGPVEETLLKALSKAREEGGCE